MKVVPIFKTTWILLCERSQTVEMQKQNDNNGKEILQV